MAAVPHFNVTTVAGGKVDYSSIWQRRNLLLVALPRSGSSEASDYVSRLHAALPPMPKDTAVVVTRDAVAGLTAPAVVIADRWGEIIHSVQTERVTDLPDAGELLEWIDYVRQRCPECEGEAR